MLDFPDQETGGHVHWRVRVLRAFDGKFERFARAFMRGQTTAELRFELIRAGSRAVTLRVGAGAHHGVLKLFDADRARERHRRERDLLLAMRGSGLVPRLTAYGDAPCFVVMEDAGQPLAPGHLDAWGAARLGGALGRWFAEYDMAAPSRVGVGTWHDHIAALGPAMAPHAVLLARETLAQVPVCGLGIAQNDAALHNFLVDDEGRLRRCDFECASLRPRGWDYVFARHSVMERHPRQCAAILDAMSAGFAQTHRGALQVEDLDRVSRILFALRAAASNDDGGIR